MIYPDLKQIHNPRPTEATSNSVVDPVETQLVSGHANLSLQT